MALHRKLLPTAVVLCACAGGTNPGGTSPGPGVVSEGDTGSGAATSDAATTGSDPTVTSSMAPTSAATTDGGDDPSADGTSDTTGCVEQPFYFDGDGDGHGNPLAEVIACEAPRNHVTGGDDCDDEDPDNAPSLDETCDGQDNDCDGLVDELSSQNATCSGCTLGERGGHAYYYCPQPQTFAAAQTTCLQFAADLIKIDDMAENDFIVAEPVPATMGVGGYLLGLSDAATEGSFVWTDGTAPAFTAWNAGEPNDGGGAEDCTEMSTTAGFWNDVPCDAGRAFICEAPAP